MKRLPEPIELQKGEEKAAISYFGISQNMEQLNPYFSCAAYNGNNSVYVATNTLRLVNFVMVFIVSFTVVVAVCVMLVISRGWKQ